MVGAIVVNQVLVFLGDPLTGDKKFTVPFRTLTSDAEVVPTLAPPILVEVASVNSAILQYSFRISRK
jgi:hypothetical protein